MNISPDEIIVFRIAGLAINATVYYSCVITLLLAGISWIITRRLSSGPSLSRGQNLLEILVGGIRNQIRDVSQEDPDKYIGFVGTLFLFIAVSNTLDIVPGFEPPTGSIHTTAALALCVFFAVPIFGIREKGYKAYLRTYIKPNPIMLPFNVIGEFSRTLALAVRLFGNIMSGSLIVGVLVSFVPLLFPIVMQAFGLIIGLIQAYIFAILAMVYIASAVRTQKKSDDSNQFQEGGNG